MTRDVIEKKVREAVIDVLGVHEDDLKNDSDFDEEHGADSLDGIELAMRLEEEFNIEIFDDEIPGLNTVAKLVAHIEPMVR